MPGDIILGDDDGVTVVPLSRADITLKAAKKQLSYESEILEKIANDEDVTRKLQNIEVIEMS